LIELFILPLFNGPNLLPERLNLLPERLNLLPCGLTLLPERLNFLSKGLSTLCSKLAALSNNLNIGCKGAKKALYLPDFPLLLLHNTNQHSYIMVKIIDSVARL